MSKDIKGNCVVQKSICISELLLAWSRVEVSALEHKDVVDAIPTCFAG
jgi:hypothetical protein